MPGLFQRVLGRQATADAPAPETTQTATAEPTAAATEQLTAVTEQPPPLDPVVPEQPTAEQAVAVVGPEVTPAAAPEESWRRRTGMRRRLRYLRRARELALRDLGGLVFDLDRFGRERPDLVRAKLDGLASLDGERRALEAALGEEHDVDVLREPGIASCPRCGALHASEAKFCSSCGLPVGPGAPLPPGPAPTTGGEQPASAEPVPGAAAAISDTTGT
jgi:hypothetical protein